jgi:hypothetical protein
MMTNRGRLILWTAFLAATAVAAFLPESEGPVEGGGHDAPPPASPAVAPVRTVGLASPEPSAKAFAPLGDADGPGEPATDIFAAKSWISALPPAPSAIPMPPPPLPPSAPPLPFSFLGRFDDGTAPKAFLLRDDKAYVVTGGQVQIVFVYLPLGIKQTLSVGSPP